MKIQYEGTREERGGLTNWYKEKQKKLSGGDYPHSWMQQKRRKKMLQKQKESREKISNKETIRMLLGQDPSKHEQNTDGSTLGEENHISMASAHVAASGKVALRNLLSAIIIINTGN